MSKDYMAHRKYEDMGEWYAILIGIFTGLFLLLTFSMIFN